MNTRKALSDKERAFFVCTAEVPIGIILRVCGKTWIIEWRGHMKPLKCLLVLLMIVAAGCQPTARQNPNITDYSPIAGYWKAENSYRGFIISDKGELLQFSNDGGLRIDVREGGTRQEGRTKDSMLYLILGPVNVSYNSENSFLEISIVYDQFVIEVPGGTISGSMKEVFQGPVDLKNGKWYATLTLLGAAANLPEDTSVQKYVFVKMD
ncbi:MAG TPA: hypothetical protein PLR31_06560 [Anaerohalosphaeraceae bacterium]|nr:hypothetical protein [Anaerohalosphaeraceae bacterium]